MDNTHTLTIHKGWQLQEETLLVDYFTACDNILGTEDQFSYTSVEKLKDNDKIKLTRHFVICNNCGQRTPGIPTFY